MSGAPEIKSGEFVLLYHPKGRTWMIKVQPGGRLQTHLGYIDHGTLIQHSLGDSISSSVGERFWILRPTVLDFIAKGARRTQVVYPKDFGYMAATLDIGPGSSVLEIGTGSGALTTFYARLVGPTGRVYSYDVRAEFLEIAKGNLARAGLLDVVELRHQDGKGELDLPFIDAASVDVGDPWEVVDSVWKVLKPSGVWASISPTMNQVERTTLKLASSGFTLIRSVEILLREIEAREGKTRPAMRMIGHTAYLTFARRVVKE